jgi:CubicO group peptidase (beta-lactamase class C family)
MKNPAASFRRSVFSLFRTTFLLSPVFLFPFIPVDDHSIYHLETSKSSKSFSSQEIASFSIQLNPEILEPVLPVQEMAGTLNQKFFSGYFSALNELAIERLIIQKKEEARRKPLLHAMPEEAGLSTIKLSFIDSIINQAITEGAMPGAQVFVAKGGMIVYEKAFGHHDNTKQQPVQLTDLYDVASITKIAATTLAVMKLFDDQKLSLDTLLGSYFKNTLADESTGNRIFDVSIKDLLTHQSGISPSLPIFPYYHFTETYQKKMESEFLQNQFAENKMESNHEPLPDESSIIMTDVAEIDPASIIHEHPSFTREEAFDHFFSTRKIEGEAETPVAGNMYFRHQFSDSLMSAVKKLKVSDEKRPQYACINMILLKMAIDSITQTPFNTFLKEEFYQSMGMNRTTFNPLNHFRKEEIIPTETDTLWRNQILHGTVHDPSAALLGGVAGNAGLFSTASDLGILAQMLLNKGIYDNKEFIKQQTVEDFTKLQTGLNRGLGFDMPFAENEESGLISPGTFGHLGFTGTALWIDPGNEIVFVILTNKVNADDNGNAFSQLRVRQKVHQAVYNAIVRNHK